MSSVFAFVYCLHFLFRLAYRLWIRYTCEILMESKFIFVRKRICSTLLFSLAAHTLSRYQSSDDYGESATALFISISTLFVCISSGRMFTCSKGNLHFEIWKSIGLNRLALFAVSARWIRVYIHIFIQNQSLVYIFRSLLRVNRKLNWQIWRPIPCTVFRSLLVRHLEHRCHRRCW